ncbi:aminotransferase [Paraburkholderia dioscoreae]|uniref:Diaminobutyrate--2-oxoglutarate transaminase n=1 Tax=Paraburkholderia dioscoreae TaxID=2604047 RepID=A0A5Q4ZUS5_9BURK|nr:aminotransferase [Paraburkholderia dioscoreae]VVD33400.1 Diaminobutyrate--2-oxoglutarate transaminase [Paraburkholderia dioscoreae]
MTLLEQLDRQHFFHPGTHAYDHATGTLPGFIIGEGRGIHLTDVAGREYIDGFSGLYCVNVGYGRDEIAERMAAQCKRLSYYHTYVGSANEPVIELSRRLIEDWAPPGMVKVFYGMSGSDANETQIKLVWYYNNILGRKNKKKIIARDRAYHGSGIVTGALTGLPAYHANFDSPFDRVVRAMCPDYYRNAVPGSSEADFTAHCVAELESLIEREGADTIAAFIAEPMNGTGGIVPPPEGYWPAVQALLRRHDILLIADEVVCGFGRLGARTGCERFGIAPDLLTFAKGLTSAYAPLSAVVVGEAFWDVLMSGSREHGVMGHGWTYSGHPLGAIAGLANLDIMERERLVDNADDVGGYLLERLRAAFGAHRLVGDIRGVGMLMAIQLMQDPATRTPFPPERRINAGVVAAAREHGLLIRALGADIVGFAPPLITTREQADDIVARVQAAFDDALSG